MVKSAEIEKRRDIARLFSKNTRKAVFSFVGAFGKENGAPFRHRERMCIFMSKPIRLAGVIRESIVDGPGIRFVVFVQGCPHHCEGCHNPESHDFSGGYDCEPEKILAEIKKNPLLDGVTFSGGEPLCQAAALLPLAKEIKKLGLNLFIYTGSIFEDLLKNQNPDVMALLQEGDFLVDGPFVLAQRDLTLLFRGSQNQRILDLPQSLAQGQAVLAPIGQ